MTIYELSRLGIKNPADLKILTNKWIAFFFPNHKDKSEGLTILTEPDGNPAAYDNPIDLQEQIPSIIPVKDKMKIDAQFIRKHVYIRHVEENPGNSAAELPK